MRNQASFLGSTTRNQTGKKVKADEQAFESTFESTNAGLKQIETVFADCKFAIKYMLAILHSVAA